MSVPATANDSEIAQVGDEIARVPDIARLLGHRAVLSEEGRSVAFPTDSRERAPIRGYEIRRQASLRAIPVARIDGVDPAAKQPRISAFVRRLGAQALRASARRREVVLVEELAVLEALTALAGRPSGTRAPILRRRTPGGPPCANAEMATTSSPSTNSVTE